MTDVSDALQTLIDENPNRTIYFPDGVYLISKPILTPAHPQKSVSLSLAAYAHLKASEDWTGDEAMVRLGASHPANDIRTVGSNYYFEGGIIDGSGVANGISIDGGRETVIRNVSIKHTKIGVHIKRGANNGSSDCDLFGINIVGNSAPDSIGLLVEGFDNTFTNFRIASCFIGVKLMSAGNVMKNIHPLFHNQKYDDYQSSAAFWDLAGHNWYNFCYSDQLGIGFRLASGISSIFDSCYAFWYSNLGEVHRVIQSDGRFESIFTNLRIGFKDSETSNIILDVRQDGGEGKLDRVILNEKSFANDDRYLAYLTKQ